MKYQSFVFCLTVIGLVCSSPDPLLPTLVLPAPLSPPTNVSNASSVPVSTQGLMNSSLLAKPPECRGPRYGYNLEPQSCENAWRNIPTDSETILSFGSRSLGTYDVPLPHRFLSEDGLCAVDVSGGKRGGFNVEHATWLEISQSAGLLVETCVSFRTRTGIQKRLGGIIIGVGTLENLVVTVESYEPHVFCLDTPNFNDDSRCSAVVDTIPVSWRLFDFYEAGETYTEPEGKCTGRLRLNDGSGTEKSSFHDIWAAAVAVNKMCVQRGLAGVAFGIGKEGRLTLALSP